MKIFGRELKVLNMFTQEKIEKPDEEFYIRLQKSLDEHNKQIYVPSNSKSRT